MILAERRLSHIPPGREFPAGHLLLAAATGRPRDSEFWIAERRDLVLGILANDGWVLVRGLGVQRAADFRASIEALGLTLADDYGDLPMSPSEDGAPGVFDVTHFPAEEAILFHNEGSHTPRAPRYIAFHCATAARSGGETPLADSARVLEGLPGALRERFIEQGLLYRRHFVEGLDASWRQYFRTTDPREVDARCAAHGIRTIWYPDGSLSTETGRPAVVPHPDTGRAVFFNQILLHHPACLDPEVRETLQHSLPDGGTPRDVTFGDGTPIPDAWVDAILEAHVRVATAFTWESGDMLFADNLRVAHARRPFDGERQHHVGLSLSA